LARLALSPHRPQEILDVQQLEEQNLGLELTAENVDNVLDEIRWGVNQVMRSLINGIYFILF
jgi:hypothetical protein